jgi:hypothetical protein
MARLAALVLFAVVAAAGISTVGTALGDTTSVTADGTTTTGGTNTSGGGANPNNPICPSCV